MFDGESVRTRPNNIGLKRWTPFNTHYVTGFNNLVPRSFSFRIQYLTFRPKKTFFFVMFHSRCISDWFCWCFFFLCMSFSIGFESSAEKNQQFKCRKPWTKSSSTYHIVYIWYDNDIGKMRILHSHTPHIRRKKSKCVILFRIKQPKIIQQ